MSTFLGIGLGPIQTGIFLLGAARGGHGHLVVAEVDPALCRAVNRSGHLQINVAASDHVAVEDIPGVLALNPADPADQEALIAAAAEADEVATALPSVEVFAKVAPWLGTGFRRQPSRRRFVYAAENHNHAAERLAAALGTTEDLPETHFLNTVVGKMSGVLTAAECRTRNLAPLTPEADRGHLVEAFNRILIGNAPGLESRRVAGLIPKPDLYPFEEAKLFGHNAIHLLLGLHARAAGLSVMSELRTHPDLLAIGRAAFIEECGTALCHKWQGTDDLFTPSGFAAYADDLLVRMVNPFLDDRIERVCRDPRRKLGWDDRLTGAMRLVLAQGLSPRRLATAAALAAAGLWGKAPDDVRRGLAEIWPTPWSDEHERLWTLIHQELTP
jgi:mannitol-1-phosphate 5-dehydrogenase